MISFFRKFLRSPLVLGLFALILVAFAIGGVDVSGFGTSASGDEIAKVGRISVTSVEADRQVRVQLDSARQEKPGLDMLTFAQGGGIDGTIDNLINNVSIEEFGRLFGMAASKKQIDGQIASIPAFFGVTGKFDPLKYQSVLQQRRLDEKIVRDDFARGILENSLRVPAGYGALGPAGIITPYASIVLEARAGQVALVSSSAVGAGAPPTEAELVTYYQRNTAKYTVPETRSIRYAMFDRTKFEGKVAPTDAEIAAAYNGKSALYAAKEARIFEQVIVQSETAATAIVAKVNAGTALPVAAKAAGFEATTLASQTKADFAALTSPAIADAAFAAAKGSVIKPMKSALGWHVVRLDAINITPAQPLSSVRAALSAELMKGKVDGALANFVAKIEELIDGGSTFDDVVKSQGLTVVTVPAVTAGGIAPANSAFKGGPELPTILRDAFQDEADADATVATLVPGQVFALYDLDRINAAAPQPLAAIKSLVAQEFVRDRAAKAARKIADDIAAKVNKGVPLATAVAQAGVKLEAPQNIGGKRRDITANQGKVPPPIALLFSMAAKRAKTLEIPNGQGWFIVYLDKIQIGDPASEPALLPQMAEEFKQLLGREYGQQLVTAIRNHVGTTRNEKAIKALKNSLTGSTAQ